MQLIDSEQQCRMGHHNVALIGLNIENNSVVKVCYRWIGLFVKEYSIDDLRIDVARHIRADV